MSTFKTIIAFLLTYNTRTTLAKDAKIFGGHNCNIKNKPFYVYLEIKADGAKIMCGGSLVSTTAVLTAGHCCFEADDATIFTGYYRPKKEFDQTMAVKTPFVIHPKFDVDSLSHDFCLAKLKSPLKITKRTQLIPLASRKLLKELMENQNETKNYNLDVMGYGVNSRNKEGEFIVSYYKPFQCTTTVLKTQNHCLDLMEGDDKKRFEKKTMFCHYNPVSKTRGTCEGDSGSPVVYDGKLIGLISWGINLEVCTEKIEVAGRLDAALDWINSNI